MLATGETEFRGSEGMWKSSAPSAQCSVNLKLLLEVKSLNFLKQNKSRRTLKGLSSGWQRGGLTSLGIDPLGKHLGAPRQLN